MRKHNKISAFLLCAFILGACVPVPLPYETPFPDEIVQFIDHGSTTRKTVLLTLGEPNAVWNNDTLFVYAAARAVGAVVAYGGHNIDITKAWFLFIEFDENGTVVRHEVGTGFKNTPCKRNGECTAFDQVWNEVPFSAAMWRKDVTASDFESYLSKHPDSVFADFAQMRLECMSITETTADAEGTGLDASTKTTLEARLKADRKLRTSIKRYYNDMKVRKNINMASSGTSPMAVTMEKIKGVEVLSVSGDLISIAVRFRWEESGGQYGRNDREILTVRKSGSTFEVVNFERENTMTENKCVRNWLMQRVSDADTTSDVEDSVETKDAQDVLAQETTPDKASPYIPGRDQLGDN